MKFFGLIFLLLLSFSAYSGTMTLASGEYAPYSGETIPNQGISTMIVKAIFSELKQDVQVSFMPWNRAMKNVSNGNVVGSYPWNINSDRLKYNYFSRPIHSYRVFAFTKKGMKYNSEKSLIGKKYCNPSGWDNSQYIKLINKLKMEVISPVNIESCFNMLALNRVDIIFLNELVGFEVTQRLFGPHSQVSGSETPFFPNKVNLYFIVSKKYPYGEKLISDFNRGLDTIKRNGVYDHIVSTISICGTCNRLGSL